MPTRIMEWSELQSTGIGEAPSLPGRQEALPERVWCCQREGQSATTGGRFLPTVAPAGTREGSPEDAPPIAAVSSAAGGRHDGQRYKEHRNAEGPSMAIWRWTSSTLMA